MERFKNIICAPNIMSSYLYFYVHFVVEVICFFTLMKLTGDSAILWFAPLLYDALAFVPQAIIGYASDKFPKIPIGFMGIILLLGGFILFSLEAFDSYLISLALIALGNAFLHVDGAEVTIRLSNGKLSHSAIFVAGGSFGVITGKLLGKINVSFVVISLLGLSMIPFLMLAHTYKDNEDYENVSCSKYSYSSDLSCGGIIILCTIFIVVVRGYMGYGLPTSWNKSVFQTILLYLAMGFGKAFGGIFADLFGAKKVGIFSTLLAIPFLLLGDKVMIISLIGVLLFSMTMSITLGILVSILNRTPGLAFGLTTIGLFLGTVPIFVFKITSFWLNALVILIFSCFCAFIFHFIMKGDVISE